MTANRKTDAPEGRPAKGPNGSVPQPAEGGRPSARPEAPEIPRPVDVYEGIPDRSAKPAKRVYLVIALVFLAWVAFLVYCAVAGRF
jgi:hypothetical protein